MNPFASLPPDLLNRVYSFLPAKEVARLAPSCLLVKATVAKYFGPGDRRLKIIERWARELRPSPSLKYRYAFKERTPWKWIGYFDVFRASLGSAAVYALRFTTREAGRRYSCVYIYSPQCRLWRFRVYYKGHTVATNLLNVIRVHPPDPPYDPCRVLAEALIYTCDDVRRYVDAFRERYPEARE